MDDKIKEAIERYQCPGCVCGSDISCYEKGDHEECAKHCVGTSSPRIGSFMLGMPIGFDRVGPAKPFCVQIFEKFDGQWDYGKFNVPAWKYLDEHKNTIIRGLSPRINTPFLHIFLEDCMGKIDCLEIKASDIAEMD